MFQVPLKTEGGGRMKVNAYSKYTWQHGQFNINMWKIDSVYRKLHTGRQKRAKLIGVIFP